MTSPAPIRRGLCWRRMPVGAFMMTGLFLFLILDFGSIYKFLGSLNVEFDETRGRILWKTTLPSINGVFFFWSLQGRKSPECYDCKLLLIQLRILHWWLKIMLWRCLTNPTRHMKDLVSSAWNFLETSWKTCELKKFQARREKSSSACL